MRQGGATLSCRTDGTASQELPVIDDRVPFDRVEAARNGPATYGLEMAGEANPNDRGTGFHGDPFRFFDNREKYLLFVTTTSEKRVVASRIGNELDLLEPKPPALRVFDAGTGNGVVLAHVLSDLHNRMPTVPFVVVGKEISMEDTRLTLSTLPDRLVEHPETAVVITNMTYAEAPRLFPHRPENRERIAWWDIGLDGTTSHEFQQQISGLEHVLSQGWQTVTSPATGNPIYATPSVLVLYRSDRASVLHDVIPRNIGAPQPFGYDLVLAAQPYRSRTPAELKVRTVLVPLAKALDPKGRRWNTSGRTASQRRASRRGRAAMRSRPRARCARRSPSTARAVRTPPSRRVASAR